MAIFLASQSPRRRELLRTLGLEFSVLVANIDESMDRALPPLEEVMRLAREKAAAIAQSTQEQDVIIGADTVVVLDGRVLGKPENVADAHSMLRQLSGRSHQVISGVCVRKGDEILSHGEITTVYFRPLSEEEIHAYVATGEPMDKAGSYGIQGVGTIFVKRIEGDYFNVVGLPLFACSAMLRKVGIEILN